LHHFCRVKAVLPCEISKPALNLSPDHGFGQGYRGVFDDFFKQFADFIVFKAVCKALFQPIPYVVLQIIQSFEFFIDILRQIIVQIGELFFLEGRERYPDFFCFPGKRRWLFIKRGTANLRFNALRARLRIIFAVGLGNLFSLAFLHSYYVIVKIKVVLPASQGERIIIPPAVGQRIAGIIQQAIG